MKKDKFYLNIAYYFADEKSDLTEPRTRYASVTGETVADCWQKIEADLLSRTQIDHTIYWDLVRVKRVHIQPIK